MSENPPSNGTETSDAAAESMRPCAAKIRQRVLKYIESQGLRGATCDEAEVATGLSHQTCSARFNELNKKTDQHGLEIVWSGATRPTRSGRLARIYVARSVYAKAKGA